MTSRSHSVAKPSNLFQPLPWHRTTTTPDQNSFPAFLFTFFVKNLDYTYLCLCEKDTPMEIIFAKEYLITMYSTGQCADKKHRYQPGVVRKYIDIINLMKRTRDVMGLCQYNSLRYEKLSGNKKGLSSVRVNNQYRIEFEEHVRDGESVATICNITDLSNHHK